MKTNEKYMKLAIEEINNSILNLEKELDEKKSKLRHLRLLCAHGDFERINNMGMPEDNYDKCNICGAAI